MTLYLKYRPKNLDQLDSQGVGESLKKIIESGNIPHAFLFAGPKGTGKTSSARILAKIINCTDLKGTTPCDKCEQCTSIMNATNLDVVEMDAASNRRIDDVRVLKDAVKLSPISAKKKVYIVDEAHMLTTEASNALLKTLEEPPSHVVFVLATTNPEKLLDTVKSRTTLVQFKKGGEEEILKALKRVADGEKIKIEEDALKVIAKAAGGAFRDAIKIFEQIVSEGKELTKDSLEVHLFNKNLYDLESFISILLQKETKEVITEIAKLESKGASVDGFLTSLITDLRGKLMIKIGVSSGVAVETSSKDLVYLIELLNRAATEISLSPVPELPLEIAVIKWCQGGKSSGEEPPIKKEEKQLEESKEESPPKKVESAPAEKKEELVITEVISSGDLPNLEVNGDIWKNILALIKPINASVEALLRAAKPMSYDGKTLTLGVYYKFHKERLEDGTHRRVVEDIVGQVLNSPVKVICTLTEPQPRRIIEEAKVKPVLTEDKDRDIIKAAEEIFGG